MLWPINGVQQWRVVNVSRSRNGSAGARKDRQIRTLERDRQGMEVDGPGVLLKGETARSNAARCLRAASKTLGYKVKSQTTAEGVVVWRVE